VLTVSAGPMPADPSTHRDMNIKVTASTTLRHWAPRQECVMFRCSDCVDFQTSKLRDAAATGGQAASAVSRHSIRIGRPRPFCSRYCHRLSMLVEDSREHACANFMRPAPFYLEQALPCFRVSMCRAGLSTSNSRVLRWVHHGMMVVTLLVH
jgi:hypothetical protein